MPRGKRVNVKVQATVDSLLNNTKEPKFTVLNSTRNDLVRGLNHYALSFDSGHSKQWAVDWAKKNMPDISTSLEKKNACWFNNTGFVLRMVQNGFILDDKQMNGIKNKLVKISEMVEPSEEKKTPKAKNLLENPNEALENLDYAIDAILCGQTPSKISLGTNRKHHDEVLAQCDKILNEMNEAPEYFASGVIRPLKKFLNEVKNQLETMGKAVEQQRVRKVITKKVNPVKMVSKMKFKRKDEDLGLESVRPEALVGARQAIVYNSKYRYLMYFKSSTEEGFAVSGSSLKNFDIEKSIFKKIRKPEDMANGIKGLTLAAIHKFMNAIKGKEFACKGRFNEDMLILKVSG